MLNKFRDFLNNNNIDSELLQNSSSLLQFEYNNLNFIAEYDKNNDEYYFRILLPKVDVLRNYDTLQNSTIMQLNSKYKVGKIVVYDNQIWITVETFVYNNVNLSALFIRMIAVLEGMYNDYKIKQNG